MKFSHEKKIRHKILTMMFLFILLIQALARQLAEVLIRGMCEKTYIPIETYHSDSNNLPRPQPRKYSGDK